jgi:hypothetical protein
MIKIFLIGALFTFSLNTTAGLLFTNGEVTFGGVVPDYDNSALTSSYLDGVTADNLTDTGIGGINNTGLFVETFDIATQLGKNVVDSPFSAGTQAFNSTIGINDGCAVNSSGGGVTAEGSFSVREDDKPRLALIGYDDNCFGYTPEDGSSSGSVSINFSGILDTASNIYGTEMNMDYLGFYWATIDTYNTFEFFSDDEEVLTFTGADLIGEINNLQLGTTSQYVNVFFNDHVYFDELKVTSTSRASEFDNIVSSITPVPEPTSLAILTLGIIGLLLRSIKAQ